MPLLVSRHSPKATALDTTSDEHHKEVLWFQIRFANVLEATKLEVTRGLKVEWTLQASPISQMFSQSRIGKGGRTMVYRNRKPEKPVLTSFAENRRVGIKKIGEFWRKNLKKQRVKWS
jgi:hypothetical protein